MRVSFLFRFLTLAAFFSVPAQAADPVNAASPGGKGSLRPMGLQETCFKSASRAMPEVCGRVQVNLTEGASIGTVNDYSPARWGTDIRTRHPELEMNP